ncbi:MAG: CvpA family protein [Synergistaceae bacterium]|nr:CvpA family protein [Synergistaceae bacterium]
MNVALIVDCVLGIILIFFLYRGLINGFSGEVIGLVGFFVSTFCAWKFCDPAAELAMRYINDPNFDRNMLSLVCSLGIFFTVQIIFAVISLILSYVVKVTRLSVTDHVFGMIAGFLKAAFITVIVYALLSSFPKLIPTEWMSQSWFMKGASFVWPPVRDLLQEHGIIDFTALTGGM